MNKCNDLFMPLIEANSGVFSWREAAILQNPLGDITVDELFDTIKEKTKTEREFNVWQEQLKITAAWCKENTPQQDNNYCDDISS
jgi:hypothetical protein